MSYLSDKTKRLQTPSRSRSNRQLLLMFVLLMITLLAGGSYVFDRLRTTVKRAVSENLVAIGSLKAGQIQSWLQARYSDIGALSGDEYFVHSVNVWRRDGKRKDAMHAKLFGQLQAYNASHHFRSVVIFDNRKRILLEAGMPFDDEENIREIDVLALSSSKIRIVDLHRHSDDSFPFRMGFIAPMYADGHQIGAIYFVEDPQDYLLPLLAQWPVKSASAEIQLVRADSDRLLFLGELRKRHDKPLTFSLPLNSPQLAAAMALRGKRGVFEHAQDYAGTKVLSFATEIKDMPWVLIAKIDEAEAYELVDEVETVALWAALLLFASSGAWFWQWLRREQEAADAVVLYERLRADELWMESEKRFRAVFEHTALPMARNTLKGEFLDVNDSWCELFGYSHKEALDNRLTWQQLIHPDDMETVQTQLIRLLNGEFETFKNENRYLRKDLKEFWGGLQLSMVRNERGEPDYFISAIHDITERKQSEQMINFMAYHDKLTGLPNRALLFDRLSQAISQAKRDGKYVALLFVDLDGFKSVNDDFGHEAGDTVLKSSAQRFLACVRAVDTVARFGGDEFAIILGNLDESQQAKGVAEKIVKAFDQNMTLSDGNDCQVGVSVGISIFPDHGSAIDSLISAADHAMYQSKKIGKGNYTFFIEETGGSEAPWITFDDKHLVGVKEIDEQHRNLVYIVNRINDALKNNESSDAIMLMFDELLVATAHHFETESRYMQKFHYPETDAHELEHTHLVNEAQHFKRQFNQGRELLALQSIKDWLLGHIVFSDKRMASYLIERGVS